MLEKIKSKRLLGVPLITAVVLIVAAVSVVAVSAAIFTLNKTVPATVTISIPTGGGGGGGGDPVPQTADVYVDSVCTIPLGSIDFGTIASLGSSTVKVYVKSAEVSTVDVSGTGLTNGTITIGTLTTVGAATEIPVIYTDTSGAQGATYKFDVVFAGSGGA